MPTNADNNISNNKKIVSSVTTTDITLESLLTAGKIQKDFSHKGENPHNKKINEELEKSHREQLILLKQNKQTIIDFLLGNKDSIRIEDLKIYEPIYQCYRKNQIILFAIL